MVVDSILQFMSQMDETVLMPMDYIVRHCMK